VEGFSVTNDEVHYLPVGLGYQHYIRPILQDFNATEVCLLTAADAAQCRTFDDAMGTLEDADVDVRRLQIDTDEFAAIVATGYDEIQDRLADGADVYVNAAASPWGLGAGFAQAAQYVIADRAVVGDESHEAVRDRVSVYYTEPAEYRVADLLDAAKQAYTLGTAFEKVTQTADELKDEVGNDAAMVSAIVDFVDEDADKPFETIFQQFEQFLQTDNEGSLDEAIHDISQGIDLVAEGVTKFSRPENQAQIDMVRTILGDSDLGAIVAGLDALAERPDDSGRGNQGLLLFKYFEERLKNVLALVEKVEDAAEQRPTGATSLEDLNELITEVESRGIAQGVRKFDGQNYVELPTHVEFDLQPKRRAILWVLATGGPAESLQQLTVRVTRQALVVNGTDGFPEDSDIDALREGNLSTDSLLYKNHIRPAIESTIRQHLVALEDLGFVVRGRSDLGDPRKTGAELTQTGAVYMRTKHFDAVGTSGTDWQDAFDELYDNIETAVRDYATDSSRTT
jgi:hypothetical protein